MRNKLFSPIWLILIALVSYSSVAFAEEADLILYNAKITTLDTQNPSATAVAIKKGRIVKIGKDSDVLKLKSNSTRVLDAHGRRIIPGLKILIHTTFAVVSPSMQYFGGTVCRPSRKDWR